MKHKVADLEGALLDAAVAKAEGGELVFGEKYGWRTKLLPQFSGFHGLLPFSTAWGWGGPILERERICLDWQGGDWAAYFEVNARLRCVEAGRRGQPAVSEWQPIETAPRDGRTVIVGWDSATVWIVRSARFVRADEWCPPVADGLDGWWSYKHSITQELLDDMETPTHWLPMPAPPNGDT